LKQWDYRRGLEAIKMKHAVQAAMDPTEANSVRGKKDATEEIQEYLEKVKADQLADSMKGVYVTDHVAKAKKLNTLSEEEDEHFYNYMKELESYKSQKPTCDPSQFESGRYERGSLLQRMFEPLALATRNADGTLVLNVNDKDLSYGMDEATLRAEFEHAIKNEALPSSEWEPSVLRQALYDELRENTAVSEEWDRKLNEQIAAIKSGNKYDVVTDLRDAFDTSANTSTFMKVLRTVPKHAFWDIKKPRGSEQDYFMNQYNPSRAVANKNFFDARAFDEYLHDRDTQMLIKPDVTRHRRY